LEEKKEVLESKGLGKTISYSGRERARVLPKEGRDWGLRGPARLTGKEARGKTSPTI